MNHEVLDKTEPLPSTLIAQHFNLFIVKFTQALIALSDKSESKLMQLQIRINQLENALVLLEKKLGIIQCNPLIESLVSIFAYRKCSN